MAFDWQVIWDRKGNSDSLDHVVVSGFEHTTIDSPRAAAQLVSLLDIGSRDSVLEVGCAAGILAQHFHQSCQYVGCDLSLSMVRKTIEINKFSAVNCQASDLIFKDNTFDKVFAFGVFHYFPDHVYARQAIEEMKRVARHMVLVADVPRTSHDDNHLLYSDEFFKDWQISEGWYTDKRFNALLVL